MKAYQPLLAAAAASLLLGLAGASVFAQGKDPIKDKADATINLATPEGVTAIQGQWRYKDVRIKEVQHLGKPTYDYEPHAERANGGAGAAQPDFDDSSWEVVAPTTLNKPRGNGKICFAWYRLTVTVPEKVGELDTAGSAVVFETTVDDYGEIWVDGKLPRRLRQTGGSIAAGFNAPNRLVIAQDAKPGQKITLAVFGINSPISASPGNFIFLRTDPAYGTKLDFYRK